jgi:hypothetical protein
MDLSCRDSSEVLILFNSDCLSISRANSVLSEKYATRQNLKYSGTLTQSAGTLHTSTHSDQQFQCTRACLRVCVRACVRCCQGPAERLRFWGSLRLSLLLVMDTLYRHCSPHMSVSYECVCKKDSYLSFLWLQSPGLYAKSCDWKIK